MNHINLERAANINKYSKESVIINITERFLYKPEMATFDSYISCVIRSTNGFYKTFRFPTERAFGNALFYLEKNPNFVPKDLIKFTR
jgi:hypothetical protein